MYFMCAATTIFDAEQKSFHFLDDHAPGLKSMWFYKARWMNVPAENQKG